MEWFTARLPDEIFALVLAFALSAIIGYERRRRLKSAGLRTHALVAVGSAVFTIVSSDGFGGALGTDVALDPSRIAAQIVSGIGFLGAGVIFVRRDTVSGLTTAASIWMSAAIGMACGARLPMLAIIATALYLVGVTVLPIIGRRFAPDAAEETVILAEYREGKGALRAVLAEFAAAGTVATFESATERERPGKSPRIRAHIRITGASPHELEPLVRSVAEVPGVTSVRVLSDADV
ncbi:MgtC/SapB family protein [Microbacterium gorillae]|uniref:MgtC/SapB family protein n=1 Tax=Microbacterium gorillae TaxID=1231063 RepID=UPI00058C8886|nr:MgtC/SapB family protein [Microbacterium gorillae]